MVAGGWWKTLLTTTYSYQLQNATLLESYLLKAEPSIAHRGGAQEVGFGFCPCNNDQPDSMHVGQRPSVPKHELLM